MYAPVSWTKRSRSARRRPSSSKPTVTSCSCSRSCVAASMCSRRSSMPAHGPRHAAREERDQHVLGIDDQLGAEAAAHVGRDHAHLVRRQVEEIGDELADLVRHLGGGPHRELVERRRSSRRRAPASPSAGRRRARCAATSGRDAGRRAQRGRRRRRGQRHAPGHVVGDVVVDGGRARRERLRRRQRLVLDVDQLARVLRGVPAVRHDGSHGLARRSARGRPRAGRSSGRAAPGAGGTMAERAAGGAEVRRTTPRRPRRGARGRARRRRDGCARAACGLRRQRRRAACRAARCRPRSARAR